MSLRIYVVFSLRYRYTAALINTSLFTNLSEFVFSLIFVMLDIWLVNDVYLGFSTGNQEQFTNSFLFFFSFENRVPLQSFISQHKE